MLRQRPLQQRPRTLGAVRMGRVAAGPIRALVLGLSRSGCRPAGGPDMPRDCGIYSWRKPLRFEGNPNPDGGTCPTDFGTTDIHCLFPIGTPASRKHDTWLHQFEPGKEFLNLCLAAHL